MFCGNCGTENANGAKFCKGCGKPLDNATEKKIIPQQSSQSSETEQASAPGTPKADAGQSTGKTKALPKNILIGAAVAIIALIVIVCVAVKSGSTVNLDKYMVIEATGYDGYGSARAVIDWAAIEEKYGDKMSFTKKASDEYGGFLTYMTPAEVLEDCVSVNLEPSSGLSNGDTVTYDWDIDEDLNTYLKCKVKCKSGSYKVTELTEVGTFDAFADLEVTFNGIAPNGSVKIDNQNSELNYYDLTCDKTTGLSNGDTVTITIDESRMEYYAETLGRIPEATEKVYTVEGLESYLSNLAEIDDSALTDMQNQASDVFNAHVAQNWGDGETLESFTYIGDYLLTTKNPDSYWGSNNVLYLIYKAQVRNSYSNDGDSYNKVNDLYWYIEYENLMVNADGKVTVDVTSYNTPRDRFVIDSGVSSGWWSTRSWSYYGYSTLDELYKTVVTSNMDSYNHEDNVDESIAPETVVEEEEEEVTTEGGYIFMNSDTELLTEDDLEGLSAEECKIARNEIYARHGRKFQDEELQAYFDALDWYEGTIEPNDFDEGYLSDTEIANKDLIVAYEEEKGYR